ncbi:hypothetical protein A2863_01160 [Candidatus Woesebacteria bacterium RIFCSPHIGHO2_01_FULL_38_9b]|uniref:Methyltransferase type 11 domain-containing protein n=1 Tax=Candidatus Woesebacteria bacterium RIFCSPHIGHO2_01_FULL_38_9b TaxID=1802493 RepID=A0A1F7Y6K3_9BACT|nr:MAG: hypothetical protein A2863_01160 [Candidatus Woesebacteria bacterium RIFCSPHIGHO2_01_FULL_38_9b]
MGFKDNEHDLLYYENSKDSAPWNLTVRAAQIITHRPANAIDLGCGAFPDTRYLINNGIYTTAVDINPLVKEYVGDIKCPLLDLVILPFSELVFPDAFFDFATSEYSLHFIPKEEAKNLFLKISNWLKPKGIFAANLLSIFDEWNMQGNTNLTFYDGSEVENLLEIAGLDILLLQEKANNDPTLTGRSKRFWDFYEFIAQKPEL